MVKLEDLPQELLHRLFQYISGRDLWLSVRPTCRKFYYALHQDYYWNNRLFLHYRVQLSERFRQTPRAVILRSLAIDQAVIRWSENDFNGTARFVTLNSKSYGTCDAIKIFDNAGDPSRRFCMTGDRNRSLILWGLRRAESGDQDGSHPDDDHIACLHKADAHEGWIWALSPSPNGRIVYTSSWDSTVKQWYILESGIIPGMQVNLTEAALGCVCTSDNVLYVTTYRRGPLLFDVRQGLQPQHTLHCHGNRSVYGLCTKPDSNFIYSIGEDQRIVSVDKRQFRVVESRRFDQRISCLDYDSGHLAVGLRGHEGPQIQYLEPDSLQLEELVNLTDSDVSNFPGHFSMRISEGATFCAVGDELKVFSPGVPRKITTASTTMDISKLDFYKGDLVAAGSDGSLLFWPRRQWL